MWSLCMKFEVQFTTPHYTWLHSWIIWTTDCVALNQIVQLNTNVHILKFITNFGGAVVQSVSDWPQAGWPRGQSFSPGRVKNFHFSISSRLALGVHPISYPLSAKALSPREKQHGRHADHSPPPHAKVKKTWIYKTFIFVGCILLHYIITLSKYACNLNWNCYYFILVFHNMFRPLRAIFRWNTTSILLLKCHQYYNGSVLVLSTHVVQTT
jgi:hypothetical protein